MNFGDILNDWDKIQRKKTQKSKSKTLQLSHKMPNAPTPEEKAAKKRAKLIAEGRIYEEQMKEDSEKTINPMEFWLRRYGVTGKDKEAEEFEERSKMENREYLRTMRPEARIDLHGLTREEAWNRLTAFVNDCLRRNLKKILIIHGKGNRERIIEIENDEVLDTLIKYNQVKEVSSDAFFLNNRGNPLTDQSARRIIENCAKSVDPSKHITPHMFRHSFATLLLEEDVDIRYIQQLLGHSSISTTQIYAHVSSEKRRAILSSKHPRNKIAIIKES